MKKKLFINLSIRLRFIFMIMLELVCVSLISWLVMDVLHGVSLTTSSVSGISVLY